MDRVTIWLDVEMEDLVEEWLWGREALSVALPARHESTRYLTALFQSVDEDEFTAALTDTFGATGFSKLRFETVQEDDWLERWKADFKPLRVGRFSLIGEWEAPEPDDHVILIYPGQAFGTGRHETTRLIIEAMEDLDVRGKSVLDAGCGTGILAIAAERLGAAEVFGFDVDPDCDENMHRHLRINRSERVRLAIGQLNDFPAQPRDLILANITINVLGEIWPDLAQLLKPGGVLLSSGILTEQRDDAEKALAAAGLKVVDVRIDGEWVMIKAIKP